MSQQSAIEWTEATINPWTGCTKVSPGCANCYIERTPPFRMDGRRFEGGHIPLSFHLHRLDAVRRRRKPTMYFVNSLSDVFHEDVPDDALLALFDTFRYCSGAGRGHVFQVLTKRPDRMRDFCLRLRFDGSANGGGGRVWLADLQGDLDGYALMGGLPGCSPLPNVWLGVSIENRRFVGRADVLRETPAAVRFISAEPLLGPLIGPYLIPVVHSGEVIERVRGWAEPPPEMYRLSLNLAGIDWLIVGGESGGPPERRLVDEHNYPRPVRARWVRALRDEALAAGTAFFFKQWGGRTPKSGGRELDGRTWDEMPHWLTA